MRQKFFVTLLALLVVVTASPVSAEAPPAETPDLTVSPAITEWIVAAGQSLTKEVVVINTAEQALPVKLLVQGMPIREKISEQARKVFDASSWFTAKNPDFILKPKEVHKATITLKVPSDAQPGGHYATFYFQQLSLARPHAQETSIVGRVGTLAFVTVKGPMTKEIKAVAPLTINRRNHDFVFETTLRNYGNIHLLPTVAFEVKGRQGKTQVTSQPGILLPHTERTYTATWQPPFMGRFIVTPQITYANGKKVELPPQTVWQVPLRWILPVVTVPPIVWFGLIRIWPRWRRAWHVLWKK